MSAEGGILILAAPVILVGGAAVALAAAAAGALAVAGAGYVAYQGVRLGVQGAIAGGAIAAEGARAAVHAGSAMVEAADKAIAAEADRQAQRYEARFREQAAQRSAAVAALQRHLKPNRTAPSPTQAREPIPPTSLQEDELQRLLADSEALLAKAMPAGQEAASDWDRITSAMARSLELCLHFQDSPLLAPLRSCLEEAQSRVANATPAELLSLLGRLESLAEHTTTHLEAAANEATALLSQASARVHGILQGLERLRASASLTPEAEAEAHGWQERLSRLEGMLDTAPDRAVAELKPFLGELEAYLAAGREQVCAQQQASVANALLKTLQAQGFQVVSDGPFGTERRIAVTQLTTKRRVVFRIGTDGRLTFDVMDGYHGEACLKLLESIWTGMEEEGIVFAAPPSLDTLHETLLKVGRAFLAEKYRFQYTEREHADEAGPHRQTAQRDRA